jgi:hypothetical protein
MDTKIVKELVRLVVENKLDTLEFEGLRIVKTRHDSVPKPVPDNKPVSSHEITDPDEILFYSSSAPALTQEQIDAMAFSSVPESKPKQRGRKSKDS